MARETKVGLLAGLAFIICFTVILSHRGGAELIPANSSIFGGRGAAFEAAAASDAGVQRPNLSLSQPGRGADPTTAPGPDGLAGPGPAVNHRTFLTPDQAALQSMTQPVPRVSPGDGAQRQLEEHLSRIDSAGQLGPAPTVTLPASTPTTTTTEALAASKGNSESIQQASPASAQPTGAVIEYVVQPGDTLSKIAQSKLGGKSKILVDAILDLNRQRISNPNRIQSGTVLQLPKVVASGETGSSRASNEPPRKVQPARSVVAPETHRAAHAPPKAPVEKHANNGFRWYQVRKNDRYMSIARAELGDGSRWDEIHRLNRDKFPDPNQIREGVRIKLPGK